MRPITVLADEGILMPPWVTDKQNTILKVEGKFIGSIEPIEQGKVYSIDAELKENQEPIKVHFLKVPQMKSCASEFDSDYLISL